MLDKIKERWTEILLIGQLKGIRNIYEYDGILKLDIAWLIAEVDRLQAENVGLRCCGNCKHRTTRLALNYAQRVLGEVGEPCNTCRDASKWQKEGE